MGYSSTSPCWLGSGDGVATPAPNTTTATAQPLRLRISGSSPLSVIRIRVVQPLRVGQRQALGVAVGDPLLGLDPRVEGQVVAQHVSQAVTVEEELAPPLLRHLLLDRRRVAGRGGQRQVG